MIEPSAIETRTSERVPAGELHLRMLEQFAPPSIVITDEHMVVHMSEHAGRFLQVPGGEPSRSVMKLVHPDLRSELEQALHLAAQHRRSVDVTRTRMTSPHGSLFVNITVKPVLREGTPARGYFVILLDEAGAAPPPPAEEAQASNEALLAMNEALRSAAEQLETSKQDLQSLINSSDVGAIVLDKSMRLKLMTPRAQRVFNLPPTDVGCTLSDITSTLTCADLHADVRQVLERLQTIDREVETVDGHWYLMRVAPYRTLDDRIEGVALTFQDITDHHRAEQQWRAREGRLRAKLEERVEERTRELQAEVMQHAEAEARASALLRRLVTAQEDERGRIARELHDQLGQQLTALRLTLERHATQAGAVADLAEALTAAGELDKAIDYLTWELRPAVLDQLGLSAALPHVVQEWSLHYGITAKAEVAPAAARALAPEAQLAFYRVAQEALTNVAKHAHASRVDLVLDARGSSVVMVIEDDGVGFDTTDGAAFEHGVGIAGMGERAALVGATLEIESSPGRGAAVYLRCPVGTAQATP
jgi:two-component system CheB/CheR fusion protein